MTDGRVLYSIFVCTSNAHNMSFFVLLRDGFFFFTVRYISLLLSGSGVHRRCVYTSWSVHTMPTFKIERQTHTHTVSLIDIFYVFRYYKYIMGFSWMSSRVRVRVIVVLHYIHYTVTCYSHNNTYDTVRYYGYIVQPLVMSNCGPCFSYIFFCLFFCVCWFCFNILLVQWWLPISISPFHQITLVHCTIRTYDEYIHDIFVSI